MYDDGICLNVCVQGSIDDRELMERILKEGKIEIVISAVDGGRILDQLILVEAIKAVGTVKVRVSLLVFC